MDDARDPFARLTDNERNVRKTKGRQKLIEGELVVPIPLDAPAPPTRHPRLGKPTARWTYRHHKGDELGYIERFDRPDGGKDFLPLTLHRIADGLRWLRKALPEPRPFLRPRSPRRPS